ncbi:hypothetical protein SUGI_1192060 [Cryptomeria japonica]|nr:hypothetical protein SUGI_1192060 [Cryptomeria japonica]
MDQDSQSTLTFDDQQEGDHSHSLSFDELLELDWQEILEYLDDPISTSRNQDLPNSCRTRQNVLRGDSQQLQQQQPFCSFWPSKCTHQ